MYCTIKQLDKGIPCGLGNEPSAFSRIKGTSFFLIKTTLFFQRYVEKINKIYKSFVKVEPLLQLLNFHGFRTSLCRLRLMASFDRLLAMVLLSIQNGFLHLLDAYTGGNYYFDCISYII